MSETPILAEQEPPPALPREDTAGALLRQAREQAGLHIAALAVAIRVPVKKLEALEADRLDLLPDAVFARALASSICRALKIDAAPILLRLPQSGAPRLWSDSLGMNVPFSSPRDSAGTPFWSQLPKPALGLVALLLVATLVLVYYPQDPDAPEPARLVSAEVVSPLVAGHVPVAPTAVAEPASLPPVVASPSPAVAAAAPVPAPAPAPVIAKITATEVLAFKTKEASWIEVTDAQGVSQLRRLVAPGEAVGVSGVLPLNVVIGRADVTEVWVRGKSYALSGVSRENVARFEVK